MTLFPLEAELVPNSQLRIGCGPRSVENDLLNELEGFVHRTREDPRLLTHPVRVLVPSRSLRLHVAHALTRRAGSTAGITVQTLFGAASEILQRAGAREGEGEAVASAGGDGWLEILARRAARAEPSLRDSLGSLEDGYRSVVASIRDLLDAGLEEATAEPLLELLKETSMGSNQRTRAAAIVRTATRVASGLESLETGAAGGSGSTARMLARALFHLERNAHGVFPTRAVLVHGFADATGLATDLLQTLLRRFPSRIWIDEPPDPIGKGRPATDAAASFAARLRERIEGVTGPPRVMKETSPPAHKSFFHAPGTEAEVRAVAVRIRALLDARAQPETIGVVARDIGPFRSALRVHFHRLGIPFSGLATRGPMDAAAGRLHALMELLNKGLELTVDRWLDAVQRITIPGEDKPRRPSFDLRLALRAAGAGRLRDAARLDPEPWLDRKGNFPLPVRTHFEASESADETEDGAEKVPARRRRHRVGRRRLNGRVFRGGSDLARKVAGTLESWPEKAPVTSHAKRLRDLVYDALAWTDADPAEHRLRSALIRLEREVPPGEELTRGEFALLFESLVLPLATPPFGGEGSGVQVLGAMEARGRTFEHLFLMGLNRDSFPSIVPEDPLLPDRVRRALSAVLPDVPIKGRSYDEERFLFAQLVAASPRTCLSWQSSDDDGRARVASPLVDRLLNEVDHDPEKAPPIYSQLAATAFDGPHTGAELAVLAGLHGTVRTKEAGLRAAFLEIGHPESPSLARTRIAVLEEFDRVPKEGELGPWFGFLGAIAPPDDTGTKERRLSHPDPLVERQYVTTFERMARCPWQTALLKILRLEPTPDPLEALPGIDKRLLGLAVHGALEKIALRSLPKNAEKRLTRLLDAEGWEERWPNETELEELLEQAAREELREANLPLPGLIHALAQRCRPYVEAAGRLFESGRLLGVELEGEASIPLGYSGPDGVPAVLRVSFRADRVEREGDVVVLTDFKTGRPISDNENPKKREQDLLQRIAEGTSLQALAYALGTPGKKALGRYLYLGPDIRQDAARYDVRGDEAEFLERGKHALSTILDGWRAGTFFPRLTEADKDKEPFTCSYCDVAEACSRHDSGARRRLWAAVHREPGKAAWESPLHRLWFLGKTKPVEKGEKGEKGKQEKGK